MRIFIEFIKSTRWMIGIMSSLTTTASFIRTGSTFNNAIEQAITVFCICSATMVLNDYIDREKDAAQGKKLASDHESLFLVWACLWWLLAIERSFHLSTINHNQMLLSLSMCVLGIVYSWLRNIPGLPMFVTAFTSALGGCYRIVTGDFRDWSFPLIVFFIILAREPLKDLADVIADSIEGIGKKTLPIVWGTDAAMTFARGSLIVGGILILYFTKNNTAAIIAIGLSVSAYMINLTKINTSKMILDLSMLCFLIKSNFFHALPICGLKDINSKPIEKFIEVKVAKSSKHVWLFAYIMFGITLLAIGCLRSPKEGIILALIGVISLIGLNFLPVNDDYQADNQPQFIRVRRMIIGMTIGLLLLH